MPQSNHKTLVRVLLWWTTLLSIVQATLLVLFFTMGHFGQPSPDHGISHGKAKMITYKTDGVHPNHTITWYAVNSEDLPTDEGQLGHLSIKKDGSFFMCLRITLSNCNRSQNICSEEVSLLKDNVVILTGKINNETLSTGLLCKTERLSIGNTLRVQLEPKDQDPQRLKIKLSQSLSSLDIIFMPD